MLRTLFCCLALLSVLAGCAAPTADLSEPVEPLGDFRAGHLIVVSDNPKSLLVTNPISDEVWTAKLDAAMEQRFRRFEGDKLYHVSAKVWEYSVPPPVIPGKSALHVLVTIWDDAAQKKLNGEPKSIYTIKVFESRITQSMDDRITILTQEVVGLIEDWMRTQQKDEGWFGGTEANAVTAARLAAAAPPETKAPPVATAPKAARAAAAAKAPPATPAVAAAAPLSAEVAAE